MGRRKKSETVDDKLKESLTDNLPVIHFDDDILECECLKAFTDKYTDKIYEVGNTYKFTFKRIKEIKSKNEKLIKIIEK